MKKLILLYLLIVSYVACVEPQPKQIEYGAKFRATDNNTQSDIEAQVKQNTLVIEKTLIGVDDLIKITQKQAAVIKDNQARIDSLIKAISEDTATQNNVFKSQKGFGKNTTGGKGGIIVKVTNLNNSGSGSLRAALLMKVPRIIVFEVSGIIKLTSAIELIRENSNFSIIGQTAPMGGITISGHILQMGGGYNRAAQPCDNWIITHVRFRNGGYNGAPDVREHNGIISQGTTNAYMENLSFSCIICY